MENTSLLPPTIQKWIYGYELSHLAFLERLHIIDQGIHVPSINMEEAGFMTYTATGQQVAIKKLKLIYSLLL